MVVEQGKEDVTEELELVYSRCGSGFDLVNFLQQDVNNFLYLPGGIYETWKPANEVVGRKRIEILDVARDEDLREIDC